MGNLERLSLGKSEKYPRNENVGEYMKLKSCSSEASITIIWWYELWRLILLMSICRLYICYFSWCHATYILLYLFIQGIFLSLNCLELVVSNSKLRRHYLVAFVELTRIIHFADVHSCWSLIWNCMTIWSVLKDFSGKSN